MTIHTDMRVDPSNIESFVEGNFKRFLVLLFLLALILRMATIYWGSPPLDKYSSRFNKDEPKLLSNFHNFPSDIKNVKIIRNPTALPYLFAITLFPLKLALKVAKVEKQTFNKILEFSIRVLLALISVATAFLLLRFVLLITNNKSLSLFSGFLFASLPISIDTAIYLKPAPLLCFLVTLFLYYAYKIEKGFTPLNNSSILKLSIIFGLLIGTKYNGVFFAPVFVYLLRNVIIRMEYRALSVYTLIALSVSAATFFLTTPSIVLDYKILLDTFELLKGELLAATGNRIFIKQTFLSLLRALGPLLFVLCFVGFIYNSRNIRKLFLFYLPIAIFIFPLAKNPMPRYFITIVPILIILGVLTFRRLKAWSLIVVCFIILGTIAASSVNFVYKYQDNRREAIKYLEKLPQTTYIFLGSSAHDLRIPRNFRRKRAEPEYIILSTPSLNQLKKLIREVDEEDLLIFYGKKKVVYAGLRRKYYWGYPMDLYSYNHMIELFDTDKYKLEIKFLRRSSLLSKYVGLVRWEPEIYIYKRNKAYKS